MRISIQLEPQVGYDWDLWKRLIPMLEDMGFADIFRSDHFSMTAPPVDSSLELVTSLSWLASHTRRVNFGSLVAPLSFRDPVMLVRQAMSLNDLSGGRMILGVGAGWHEGEHQAFGYPLGDKRARLDRLAEGLEVITSLARGMEPVSYTGQYYRLEEALLLPRPEQPTRILVGGSGPQRTLPLVARYADIWNTVPRSLEAFRENNARLDQLLTAAGRRPTDVQRTVMVPAFAWRTQSDLERAVQSARRAPSAAHLSAEEILHWITSMNVNGAPDQVVAGIQAYADAGVETFVLQWLLPHDIPALELLATEVLPHFAGSAVGTV